jgi:regulatory protein
MAERGYLDDADAAERFARRGVDKLWGPRRIKEDLFARGFTAEVIENILSELEDVDFAANCAVIIRRKYGGVPKDMATRRKLAAALVRQGYTSEHINCALRAEVD